MAVVLLAALLVGGGAPAAAPAELPDAGPVTGWGLPLLTLAGGALAVGVVAGLLAPLLVARTLAPTTLSRLSAARLAARLSLLWSGVVAAQLVLSVADLFAVAPWDLPAGALSGFATGTTAGRLLVVQVVLAALLAAVIPWARTFGQVLACVALALVAASLPVLTGHAASSGSHDLAIVSLLVHVLAATVWVGGVLALWWHHGAAPVQRALAARRFSLLAAWCLGLVAASGAANAWVGLADPAELLRTSYGALVLAKVGALAAIGLVALRLRAMARGGAGGQPRFAWLTGIELTAMGAALALGAALSRTPPPVGEVYTTGAEVLLGGPLPPPPTPATLAWSWTASGVGLLVVGVGLAAYLAGVLALRRRGDPWSWLRTVSWLGGLAIVGYATLGGLGAYAHVLFSAHMASHMLLSMLAPILLVLGAPVTLALRALPGGAGGDDLGPRQVLSFVLRAWPLRVATHPAFVVVVFVVSLYGVYFTGFFGWVMTTNVGHAWMQLHFLVSGYLLFELVIGSDPLPRRLPHLARLLLMLLIAPFHAFFAIAVMDSARAIGGSYYERLDRPYLTDLLADQHVAGSLVWAFGELPAVLVVLALLGQWFVRDRADAARFDRREERAGEDSELAAYNRMLRRAAEREQPRS